MTLPLFLELKSIRVIQAAWIPDEIEKIRTWTNGKLILDESLLKKFAVKGSKKYDTIETLLKGVEFKLPDGVDRFKDKDGNLRDEIRVMWWQSAKGKTYEDMLFPQDDSQNMGQQPIKPSDDEHPVYTDPVPVFFGHYWVEPENLTKPQLQSERICCLDYSIANKDLSKRWLVAYCWDGEAELKNDHFEFVEWAE
jgi:hypothetical protein